MKAILIGIGLFVASFILLFQIALLAVVLRPSWFGRGSEPLSPALPETTQTASLDKAPVNTDSLAPANANTTVSVAKDSVSTQTEAEPPVIDTQISKVASDIQPDSARQADLRSKAKLLESMDPETAAKILANLKDDDVKSILMAIKKRQAGKILGAMMPERASRILQ
jgi:hypothetical protein